MWKKLAYGIVSFALCINLLQLVCDWVCSRITNYQADEILRDAEVAMDADATVENAQDWLRLSGFESVLQGLDFPVGFSEHTTKDGTTRHLAVIGQRQLVPEDWFLRPRWINVEFLFDEERNFQQVTATEWPVEIYSLVKSEKSGNSSN